MTPETWILAATVFAVAVLYSSVGHGGASGYLAVMALAGFAPAVMRPTALGLNILVATLAAWSFRRAGWFSWRLLWPFALGSIPTAALGGALTLPDPVYKRVVGVVLLVAAVHLFWTAGRAQEPGVRSPPLGLAIAIGAGLGILAGLTGVGGGIFLSPLLLAAGWAGARETAAVSAAFILVNSIAGLVSLAAISGGLPAVLWPLALAAGAGGVIGSRLGSLRLGGPAIRRILAAVLVLAAVKFIFLL